MAKSVNVYTSNETNALLNNKQDKLVSGQNIKTINNQSIVGSGNISISGGSSDLSYETPIPDVSGVRNDQDNVKILWGSNDYAAANSMLIGFGDGQLTHIVSGSGACMSNTSGSKVGTITFPISMDDNAYKVIITSTNCLTNFYVSDKTTTSFKVHTTGGVQTTLGSGVVQSSIYLVQFDYIVIMQWGY